MKSQINFKAISMFVLVSLLVFSASVKTATAQTNGITANVESKPELQVKFIGTTGEFLYFELTMLQADESRSSLRIRNENGNEIYFETVSQKAMIRKLKIAKGEAEKLEFVYNTTKGEVKKVIEIKIKLQETVEVKDIVRL
ncbi:MAG: hypothetical protein ACKVOW_09705 [Chitinophagaceae bacterium]